MKNKVIIVTFILLCFITIGAVNATNETCNFKTGTAVTSDTTTQDYVYNVEKTITKTDNNIKTLNKQTFNDLNKATQNNNNSVINFEDDYSYSGNDIHYDNYTNVNIETVSNVYTIITDNVDAHKNTTIDFYADVFSDNMTVHGGIVYFQIDGNYLMDDNGTFCIRIL